MVAVACTLLTVFFGLAFGSAPTDVSRMTAGRTAVKASIRAARESVGALPLAFVTNQGQEDVAVSYYCRSAGATVFFTAGGPVFAYPAGSISVRHCGNRQVVPEGRGALTGTVNLFIGNDPGLWRSGIPTFSQVVYPQVLPGIDLVGVFVGVGIGGTFETTALLAKQALLRPIGSQNPDPELAALEQELYEEINALGIGPQGLGGRITSLAVHVNMMASHIASLPVAVNIQCHAARHKEMEL